MPKGGTIGYANTDHPFVSGIDNVVKEWKFEAGAMAIKKEEWLDAIGSITDLIFVEPPQNIS